ncbi:MAG: SdrD B-like domain-containing protein, partial [Pseudomonadota bacterium]
GAGPQNTNQGPGGGEYYADGSEPFTDEVPMGGVLAIPGYPDVALTVFDPIPVFEGSSLFDGGVRWLSNTSGGYTKSYRVYDGIRAIIGSLGKANGLGDLDAFCDPAPVEIGNRIWRDPDGDGIQDANEPGIAGVTVALCAPDGSTIATAVTDANGNYYFSSSAGTNTAGAIYGLAGIRPNTQGYKLKLNNPANTQAGGPLAGHTLSPADAGGNAQDQRDSDAMVMNGVNVVPFNTGVAGANNHTFDFGFVPQSQPPTITCPPNQTAVATSAKAAHVTYPPPTVTPATATVTCTPASGSTFPVGTTTVTCTATSGTITSSCSFTVTVGLQPTITCPPSPPAVTATGPNGAVVTYTPPTATPATATVTCTPASGSTFPVGTTTVNCTATSGTLTATCSFQVTVNARPQGADLAVTKTDNQTSYTPGQLLVYSITVTNNGPSNVDNATIGDNLPIALQNVNWTCQITAQGTGPGTSACGRANGTGDISTTVSLKSGGVASFNVRARVSESASGNLVNTVRVTNPPGVPDPNPGNNSATDTDTKFNGTPPPPGPVGPGIPLPGWSVLIYPVYT